MALINPILIEKNAMNAFRQLKQNVHNSIQQGTNIDHKSFYASLKNISDRFELQNQHYVMNSHGANFAENLVSNKQYNLALIIYGILIKSNERNPFLLEHFGQKALAAAKKTQDPIHIMARAEDLNRLYSSIENGSKKHLQVLAEEEKALTSIVSNYDMAIKNYKTISREPLPFEHYEFMLCSVKMDIARINLNSNPLLAINELESAQKIMYKHGDGTISRRIRQMLNEAYSKL